MKKIYYFMPYVRTSTGYNRLCYAVSTLSDKSLLQFIDDLMLAPEYKSVEFFEVFFRSEDDWSDLKYLATYRVVDFQDLTITI